MDSIFRKLPLFKGKARLAKLIFRRSIISSNNITIKGKFGCEYHVPNITENIGFDIFINGIYEQETSDFIIRKLPKNGVFLDLGANIGAITIPVYKKRKDIIVVCVEAAPWIYSYLKQNLLSNNAGHVHTVNKALFYTDNETVSFYSPQEKFGKGSLSPVFTSEMVSVKTISVDSMLRELGIAQVDIIKIDVEGFEYHVFKGANALLSSPNAPDIIFEFVDWAENAVTGVSSGASQQILIDMGYQIFYFGPDKRLKSLNNILKEGSSMLFASKKNIGH